MPKRDPFGAVIQVIPGRKGGRTLYLLGDGGDQCWHDKKLYKTEGCSCCSTEYSIVSITYLNSPEYPEMLKKCLKERKDYFKRLLAED